MRETLRTERTIAVRQKAWRALDLIASALLLDTVDYPVEYDRARELTR